MFAGSGKKNQLWLCTTDLACSDMCDISLSMTSGNNETCQSKLFVELHADHQVGDVVKLVGLDMLPHVGEPPELFPEHSQPSSLLLNI